MAIYGYTRVSTDGQSLRSQTEALHAAHCERIFAEKLSGDTQIAPNSPEL